MKYNYPSITPHMCMPATGFIQKDCDRKCSETTGRKY